MRVVHVITRLIVGGAQENTLASVIGLRQQQDWDIRLVSGPSPGPEGSLEHEGRTVPGLLTVLPHLVRPIHPWNDGLVWRQLVRLFRAQAPMIVHTHSGKAGFLGRLAAHRAGVPLILHTIHGPSFGPFQGPLANGCFLAAERMAGRFTHHFITVAHAMTRQYLAAGIGEPQQYTRILSGFKLDPFLAARNDASYRAQWHLTPQDVVVGKIARLFKLKGHDDLLSVAPALIHECPNVRFLLVGDGPWRGRLEQKIDALRLRSHFVFTGLVEPREIPRLVGIMDVLVHLSRREGLPRALPQALAAARPVVAYDCDGAGEICQSEQTGFLVPVGDRAGLYDCLRRLLREPELRTELGRRGQQIVQDLFPVEKMICALDQLYRRLLAERGLH
jgi:glycosyltransferase involved in cell wall biosynthesis